MNAFDDWMDGLTEGQLALQYELSCLADGELDESAAAQVLVKIEGDTECATFFEEIQRFARMHRDVLDPERISARVAMLGGDSDLAGDAAQVLDQKLASIFYQLGKAYILSGMDFDRFREQVFARAVPIQATKAQGRGFVDGVLQSERAGEGASRWSEARHLFNGRLERIQDPIEKGIRLLQQALEIESDHEEARIYLAFVYGFQGHALKAERLYGEVFDTAVSPENRGHAAMQIGQLHTEEGEHRLAATYYRWITLTGLAEQEPRFWPAYFNLAIASLGMGRLQAGMHWFRELLNRFPERGPAVASLCMASQTLRKTIDADPAFAVHFEQSCPELFSIDSQGGLSDEKNPENQNYEDAVLALATRRPGFDART